MTPGLGLAASVCSLPKTTNKKKTTATTTTKTTTTNNDKKTKKDKGKSPKTKSNKKDKKRDARTFFIKIDHTRGRRRRMRRRRRPLVSSILNLKKSPASLFLSFLFDFVFGLLPLSFFVFLFDFVLNNIRNESKLNYIIYFFTFLFNFLLDGLSLYQVRVFRSMVISIFVWVGASIGALRRGDKANWLNKLNSFVPFNYTCWLPPVALHPCMAIVRLPAAIPARARRAAPTHDAQRQGCGSSKMWRMVNVNVRKGKWTIPYRTVYYRKMSDVVYPITTAEDTLPPTPKKFGRSKIK